MEKFECGDCGCYYWVDDRNTFDCPNCEQLAQIDAIWQAKNIKQLNYN
jgi:Zn finger protein HypA/HybF involved in hydrogenase expression